MVIIIMILYRAMCLEEYKNTKDNSFSFIKRYKWFSNNIEFIKDRVKDGKFNNSIFVKGMYTHLIKLEIDDEYITKLNEKEYMLDRRINCKYSITKKGEM